MSLNLKVSTIALNLEAKMPRISILSPTLSKGGLDRAYVIAQALQTLNYDVEILGFLFPGDQIYPAPPPKLHVESVPGGIYPQLFGNVKQLLDKINGDIIYAVKPKPTSFGIVLLKTFFHQKPVILDIDDWELSWHGGDQWQYRPSLKQFYRDLFKPNGQLRYPDHPQYLKWMERLVTKANAVTVDTEFLQQRFGGVYLPNGKDTQLFDPQRYDPQTSRERYGLDGYRILMFPGAPRPHKGVEDVLVALEQLNTPDLRLVLVGDSPYDDYDQQLMQKWGRWIIQLPRSPVEAMPEIVAAAHVVVVPQRDTLTAKAQFPLKLTDGMAMAKPILSTRVGDIPEIIGDTGYLVDPGSPEQIAETLTKIFDHFEDAQAKGCEARQRCIENYSIDAMAIILEEVINKLR